MKTNYFGLLAPSVPLGMLTRNESSGVVFCILKDIHKKCSLHIAFDLYLIIYSSYYENCFHRKYGSFYEPKGYN